MSINLKRAYDAPATSDGYRILVDRIWPRGIVKGELQVDASFKERYARELEQHSDALEQLVARAKAGRVTLVFGTKDTEHNNAVALKEQLDRRLMR
jgi:uncharacterized protein YeaO (DUF488 family)